MAEYLVTHFEMTGSGCVEGETRLVTATGCDTAPKQFTDNKIHFNRRPYKDVTWYNERVNKNHLYKVVKLATPVKPMDVFIRHVRQLKRIGISRDQMMAWMDSV
jgi:hypothetical protein